MINVFQVLREADPANADHYTLRIKQRIDDLFRYFVKSDHKVLLETVADDGSMTEGCEGRCLNPGSCHRDLLVPYGGSPQEWGQRTS